MSKNIQAIRGMRDILPDQSPLWRWVEAQAQDVLMRYGYKEIRTPILEMTELFKRSIGEVTDIVEKEMYTFDDRNGDSLTLRPEGTAGCVRAGLESGLFHNQIQRLWYQGPIFRHERPQKGRYRQFQQIGAEAIGISGPEIELELILLAERIWRQIGLKEIRLELNTLGNNQERKQYRAELIAYLESNKESLDQDSLRRMHSNPLRVLDSKNPDLAELIDSAPNMGDILGDESRQHFEFLCQGLDQYGVIYTLNPRLVRGLDYYSHTVFEWKTDQLGAQGTICAGGRYDALIEQLGGRNNAAVGFALGTDRIVALLESDQNTVVNDEVDIYLVLIGDQALHEGIILAEQIRDTLPSLRVIANCGGGGIKAQFKRADRSGAGVALIIGEEELKTQTVGLKFLREKREQIKLSKHALYSQLGDYFLAQ